MQLALSRKARLIQQGGSRSACFRPLRVVYSAPVRSQTSTSLRSANSNGAAAVAPPEEEEAVPNPDEDCSLVFTNVDNKSDETYTILTVSVNSYPALMRTVAWTLNGLGIRAQNATMTIGEDGFAEHKYWLLTYSGKKLSDRAADQVGERIGDFVRNCQSSYSKEQMEWSCDNMYVSNTSHPQFTELVIVGEPRKPGFLLEISSVLSSIGSTVHDGVIQGDAKHVRNVAPEGHDFEGTGRIFRFLLSATDGSKLSPERVNSVLYTLDLVAGKGHAPTTLF